jgi:mono/diheme cytochrome c family protein
MRLSVEPPPHPGPRSGRVRRDEFPLIAVAVLCLAIGGCTPGTRDRADPAHGHEVAEHWCSECHRVSPEDASGARAGHILPPPVNAPSFMAIARKPDADAAYLERFTGELHLPMPTFRLSAAERRDVVAYILTLK